MTTRVTVGATGKVPVLTAQELTVDTTVTAATYTQVNHIGDLLFRANPGDLLLVGFPGSWGDTGQACDVKLDVASIVAGNVVNFVSGHSAAGPGIVGWDLNSAGNQVLRTCIGAPHPYTVVAGDLDGIDVRLRLMSRCDLQTGTLIGGSYFYVLNFGH